MLRYLRALVAVVLFSSPLIAANTSTGGGEQVPPAGPVVQAPEGSTPAFAAGTWNDNAVHLLDANLADISSFPAGAALPNGVAFDGTLLYTGHFLSQEVIAYDLAGVEQFRWSDGGLAGLQGLTIVGSELAVMDAGSSLIRFYDPVAGNEIRSFSSGPDGGGVEGLTYDGTYLWALGNNSIYGMDPVDGSIDQTIPNAALNCSYTGTGIAVAAPGELVLGCADGTWYRVSSADGSVLDSGNNGLDMYGLEAVVATAPTSVLSIPTLGAWGAAALVALLAVFSVALLRRRRAA